MYQKITGFTWLPPLVTLLRAGIPDMVALDDQIASASLWLASHLKPIRNGLIGDLNLPEAMRATGYGFPSPDLINEIGTHADSDDFIDKIAMTVRRYAEVIEWQLFVRGMLMSVAFAGFMFPAFVVLQPNANSLSPILTPAMGRIR